MTDTQGQARWRLSELLFERGGMTHKAVADALSRDGAHPVSRTQVGRLAAATPHAINFELIGALCRILKCTPNDLFGWTQVPVADRRPLMNAIKNQSRKLAATGQMPQATAAADGAPALTAEQRRQVVGPTVRAMPNHPLARKIGGKA